MPIEINEFIDSLPRIVAISLLFENDLSPITPLSSPLGISRTGDVFTLMPSSLSSLAIILHCRPRASKASVLLVSYILPNKLAG